MCLNSIWTVKKKKNAAHREKQPIVSAALNSDLVLEVALKIYAYWSQIPSRLQVSQVKVLK